MAGIYLHIPFCKKICYYCDFYRSRDLSLKGPFLEALKKEISMRATEGEGELFETVYFGGGTPSVLSAGEVEKILQALQKHFRIAGQAEITFEANPEDVDRQYAADLRRTGVNRISIGCQSFRDGDLQLMHRRHDAGRAVKAVEDAAAAGFDNISVDLIYGIPQLAPEEWKNNLFTALQLPVNHLSAYLLTFEEGTVFGQWLKKGKIQPPAEETVIEQYRDLVEITREKGFVHYEISNFGKKGFFSKHNLLYWSREKYLGFGPSAHSYDLRTRQWNVSDLKKYTGCAGGDGCREKEVLNLKDRYNDYVLTSLRTMWGAEREFIRRNFSRELETLFLRSVRKWIETGHVLEKEGKYVLTDAGILVSDTIISDCMAGQP